MVFNRNGSFLNLLKRKGLIACGVAALLMPQGAGSAMAETVAPAASLTQDCSKPSSSSSSSSVVYEQDGSLSKELNLPLYTWRKPGANPRGVVLAVHGLAMHGKSYDAVARSLAEKDYVVVATDLHGYGSYLNSNHRFCDKEDLPCKEKTNYCKSYEDIASLAHGLKKLYPSCPLFAVGESLGGALVIRLAGTNPDLLDGLILSAPALRHHTFMDTNLMVDASFCMTNPRHQLDLTPFVKRYSSDDPRIVEEVLADPMSRKHMSAYELYQVSAAVHKTVNYVASIPEQTPVLVIQGSADKCVKAESVLLLLSQLRSIDQTVRWFPHRGHILIETAYVKPDTMDSITSWLDSHVNGPELQAKYNKSSGLVAEVDSQQQVDMSVSGILYARRSPTFDR